MDVKEYRHETAGILLEKRIIMVEGNLTEETMVLINTAMIRMDQENDKEITFYFRSQGGHAAYGMINYDVIRGLRSPTRGVVARADSAASIILMGCKERCILPSGLITIHSPRPTNLRDVPFNSDFNEHMNQIKKFGDIFADRAFQIFLARTKMDKKKLAKEIRRGDVYELPICAKKAKKLGLVDKILNVDNDPPELLFR